MCSISYHYILPILMFMNKCSKGPKRPFSRKALDQVHEQNNKIIKGVGGATSLLDTQDKSAPIRWETCGPEVARILSEFEDSLCN